MRLKLVKSNILDKGSVPHVSFRFLAASMPFLSSHQQAWFLLATQAKMYPQHLLFHCQISLGASTRKRKIPIFEFLLVLALVVKTRLQSPSKKKIDVLPQDDNFRLICGFLRCCCCEIHMFLGMEPLIVARKIGYEFGQRSQIWYHFCVIFAANLIANVK